MTDPIRPLGDPVILGGLTRQQYRNSMFDVFERNCGGSAFGTPFHRVFHGLYVSLKPSLVATGDALIKSAREAP